MWHKDDIVIYVFIFKYVRIKGKWLLKSADIV